MPNTVLDNTTNQATSEENEERYTRISLAIDSLKERSENRRGPFILSDEDLNEQFRIK